MKVNYLYSILKGTYVMKNLTKNILMLVLALTLNACTTAGSGEKVKNGGDLETLVQAVQYAINKTDVSRAWIDFSNSAEGWDNKCDGFSKAAEKNKALLLEKAGALCSTICKNGSCNPPQAEYCTLMAAGKDIFSDLDCDSPKSEKGWCSNAEKYNESLKIYNDSLKLKKVACNMAESIAVPELKKATLEVALENKTSSGAKLQLLVFSVGASKDKTTTKTMTIQLEPVASSAKDAYCAINKLTGENCTLDKFPDELKLLHYTSNGTAESLGNQIHELILDHVKASGFKANVPKLPKAVADPQLRSMWGAFAADAVADDKKSVEVSLMPSSFKIELQVAVTKTGGFEVGTNLLEGVGPSLGFSKTGSAIHKIVIEYER